MAMTMGAPSHFIVASASSFSEPPLPFVSKKLPRLEPLDESLNAAQTDITNPVSSEEGMWRKRTVH